MRKKRGLLILVCILMFVLTGCNTSIAYTYKVDTGDSVKVKLDTTDGYKLSSEVPFSISTDEELLSQGTFITRSGYEQYLEFVANDTNAEILEEGTKEQITYTFYMYDNAEYNYIIEVDGSNTGILLVNGHSQKEAEMIFDLLTISLE